MDQISLQLPRIAILFLVPVELGIVAWYFLYWDLFPKWSVRRLFAWSIFILTVIGVPLLQIFIYRSITSVANVDGSYVLLIIFSESILAVALVFYLLFKRRSRNKELP